MYRFLCGHLFLFLLGLYLDMELLGHMITLSLIVWRTARVFSKLYHFTVSSEVYDGSSFSMSSLTSSRYCPFLIPAVLVDVQCVRCDSDLIFPNDGGC